MTEIFNSTELRRELHPLAELGLNTKNTAQYVLDHLKKSALRLIGLETQMVSSASLIPAFRDQPSCCGLTWTRSPLRLTERKRQSTPAVTMVTRQCFLKPRAASSEISKGQAEAAFPAR